MKQVISCLVFAALIGLVGCAGAGGARAERVFESVEPPADFALGATVLRPVPLALGAGVRTAGSGLRLAERPARYLVEADAVLRAAIGPGASETTYPPRTRQLSREQWAELWREFRAMSLAESDHPAMAGRAPTIDEAAEASGGRTTWVITFAAAGDRRTLVIHEGGEGEGEARRVVERLAGLAWVRG